MSWDQLQSFRRALRDKGTELSRGDAKRVTYQEFVGALIEAGLLTSISEAYLPKDIAKKSCVCVFSPGEDSKIYIFITGTFCHGTDRQVPLPSVRRVSVMARVLGILSDALLVKMGGWDPVIATGIDDLT